MLKLTTRGSATAAAIRDRATFTTSGALSGDRYDGIRFPARPSSGYLNSGERDLLFATPDIDYIVRSYATPIAWHSASKGWHKVAQKFSVTTSKHQGNLYLI